MKKTNTPSRKRKESVLCYVVVGLVALSCFLPF